MADRTVHYEAAFEELLRQRQLPYVAVDEARRALFSKASLKSFDFVVYRPGGPNLLIDVKGRSCRDRVSQRGFDTWATEQDVDDLIAWQRVFGVSFLALFAFVYWVERPLVSTRGLFEHKGRCYVTYGIPVMGYRDRMRRRSRRWRTVYLSAGDFRCLASPMDQWLSFENEVKASDTDAGRVCAASGGGLHEPFVGPG